MGRFRLASLRDRLVLVVLLAALPALALVLYTNLEERRLAAATVQADALRLARIVARLHEELIDGGRRLLVTLGELPESRLEAGCSARYAVLLPSYPGYANIGVAGPDGSVGCSAIILPTPVNVSDRPWFDRAVRSRAFAVGEPELEAGGRRSVLVVANPLAYPSGGTQAVVFAALDLGELGQLIGAAGLPAGWSVAVSDEGGAVLARYPEPAQWLGQPLPEASVVTAVRARQDEGSVEVAGSDGDRRFHAFAPLRGTTRRAYVSVTVPRAAAFAGTDRILTRNLGGLGVVTVLALLAAWFGSDWLVLRRVRRLVAATERLRAGELASRADVGGGDEIGELARAFDGMAARLQTMVAEEQEAKRALAGRVNALVAERTHEVNLLNQMSELLQACLTPDEAYAIIGQMIGQFFPEESGTVLVMAASRDAVRSVAAWGAPMSGGRQIFTLDECWALRRGRVYQVEDGRPGPLCLHLESPPPPAYLCVPLVAQGEALGVLHLRGGHAQADAAAPEDRVIPEPRRRLAVAVAEQFALALANLRLRETLRSQSIRDSLTGLFNRRYMEETLDRELRRAEREGRALSVVMLDVDRFKRVNDSYGHEAGDAVLAALGGLLRGICRAGDVACRFGGEEFVLILPAASLPDARRRADEMRAAVRDLQVTHDGRPLGPVRCSIGVSAFPDHGATVVDLLRAADAALYRAKHEGRDQVIVAD
jgi:diguanylate cyclase (GGDEF)-like protein